MGEIDEEQLFYLISRGISEKSAAELLYAGFIKEPLSLIENDKLRQRFSDKYFNIINELRGNESNVE